MATYIALTTTNAAGGWSVVTTGEHRATVEQEAVDILTGGSPVDNIWTQTAIRNLTVATKTQVKRNAAWRAALERYNDQVVNADEPEGNADFLYYRYS